MEHLNRRGDYRAVYVNVEAAQAAREDVERGIRAILSGLGEAARTRLADDFPNRIWPDVLARVGGENALAVVLGRWAEQ